MGLRKLLSRDSGDASDALPAAAPLKGAGGSAALIDAKSQAEYKKQVENHRHLYRHATDAEILHHVKEYIKKKIDGIVDEAQRKRVMDITTVAMSVASSTLIPFSGVAVVVAATVMQCLNFSVTLGLIPLLNVRSAGDVKAMSSQIGTSISRASKDGLMAGVETAVLEILKSLGLGDWLWTEILKDILIEMIGSGASDGAWIMTPLLAVPKYMLHRHLVKKMYRKLGDKAHVVHHTWTEHHCVATVQTTVVTQVAVDANGYVQGAYIQAQEVNGAGVQQVSQTNAYFQQPNGGVPQAQVTQTNAYFQPQNGQAQVTQTNAYFQPQNGQAQVTQTNAYFQPQNGQAQVTQTSAYIQLQAPKQEMYPPLSANQAVPGMVPSSPQAYPGSAPMAFQPAPKQGGTLVMGYAPPKNSEFFQPQVQVQGTQFMGYTAPANAAYFQGQAGVHHQAAAAAQVYTPQPSATYFQQPYGSQAVSYPPQQPQGNPYVQVGDYRNAQKGTPQGNPYVQVGDYRNAQKGTPQGNPYVQVGDYKNAQNGTPQGNPYVHM